MADKATENEDQVALVVVRSLRDGSTFTHRDAGPDSASRERMVRALGSVAKDGKLVFKPLKAIPGLAVFQPWSKADDAVLAENKDLRARAQADFEDEVSEVVAAQKAQAKEQKAK